jgi:hypothetical protein
MQTKRHSHHHCVRDIECVFERVRVRWLETDRWLFCYLQGDILQKVDGVDVLAMKQVSRVCVCVCVLRVGTDQVTAKIVLRDLGANSDH